MGNISVTMIVQPYDHVTMAVPTPKFQLYQLVLRYFVLVLYDMVRCHASGITILRTGIIRYGTLPCVWYASGIYDVTGGI